MGSQLTESALEKLRSFFFLHDLFSLLCFGRAFFLSWGSLQMQRTAKRNQPSLVSMCRGRQYPYLGGDKDAELEAGICSFTCSFEAACCK